MNGGAYGRLVRERREALAMSQRALARAVGVTPAYISLIEQGRRSPDRDVSERLARALARSPAETDDLVAAAGFHTGRNATATPAATLTRVQQLLDDAELAPDQRSAIETLVLVYADGLVNRAREGRPLVADVAAPWQARILEALQDKMTEDFEHFRDAYVNRIFEL